MTSRSLMLRSPRRLLVLPARTTSPRSSSQCPMLPERSPECAGLSTAEGRRGRSAAAAIRAPASDGLRSRRNFAGELVALVTGRTREDQLQALFLAFDFQFNLQGDEPLLDLRDRDQAPGNVHQHLPSG